MTLKARLVKDEDEWTSTNGEESEIQIEYRIQTPFSVVKQHDDEDDYQKDENDVIISGPVYVGGEAMLDRHSELVEMSAILEAWDGYKNNPVILYNHRKDYGVIGRMLDVTLGSYEGLEGDVPIGRAIIDGGEEDITRKIRKGMLKAFSIGFIAKAAVKECKDEDSCYIKFTEIDWLETSVVDVPASPGAIFNVEKHIVGYEDRGDSIAILFEKEHMEPAAPAGEAEPVEEAKTSSDCTCSKPTGSCKGAGDDPAEPSKDDDTDYDLLPGFEAKAEDYGDIEGRIELLEAFVDAMESRTEKSATVKTPLVKRDEQGQTMTTEEVKLKEAEEEAEEVLEEEGEEEAPLTEEAEVITTEAEAEETLEAEAEEEESASSTDLENENSSETINVLIEVVKNLANLESRLSSIESRLDTNEKHAEEISALKSALDEKDATIQTLTQEKEAAEAEATIEAEVSKRVATTLSSVGVEAPTVEPSRKSITEEPSNPKVSKTTDYDPQPAVSPGMNGLGNWLADQLAGRGRQ